MTHHVCMVFFRSDRARLRLDDAIPVLAKRGLRVREERNALHVQSAEGPELQIMLSTKPHVVLEAAEIAEGSPFLDEMKRCDARFEIVIDDLDQVLDEINTLIDVQSALQEATGGYLFNSWNGELSGPEESA